MAYRHSESRVVKFLQKLFSFLFFWLILLAPIVENTNDEKYLPLNDYTVVRIRPKGFRIALPYENNTYRVDFYIRINQSINPPHKGDFSGVVRKPMNGFWVFDDINTYVEPKSTINFWVTKFMPSNDFSYGAPELVHFAPTSAVVTGYSIETPEYCPSYNPDSEIYTNTQSQLPICEPSLTTLGHKATCRGQIIFFENFETLNMTIWTHEVRMPFDAWDAPFMSYQDRPDNCFAERGLLIFKPTLQSEVPGFNEASIRNGLLKLKNCTAAADKPWECTRQARFSQILPPIVSAKLNTKNSFTFRYGNIEIGASVGIGDWVIPLMQLEPVENYYGDRHHASGIIKILYTHGNVLVTNSSSASPITAYGGVLISSIPSLSAITLKRQRPIEAGFHVFHLKWTENYILVGIDGHPFVTIDENFATVYSSVEHAKQWEKGAYMAPFDREFYLSLGVSVGGHFDFPDIDPHKLWKNGDPKAMLDFWNNRNQWQKTWDPTSIEIDYIKVTAI